MLKILFPCGPGAGWRANRETRQDYYLLGALLSLWAHAFQTYSVSSVCSPVPLGPWNNFRKASKARQTLPPFLPFFLNLRSVSCTLSLLLTAQNWVPGEVLFVFEVWQINLCLCFSVLRTNRTNCRVNSFCLHSLVKASSCHRTLYPRQGKDSVNLWHQIFLYSCLQDRKVEEHQINWTTKNWGGDIHDE